MADSEDSTARKKRAYLERKRAPAGMRWCRICDRFLLFSMFYKAKNRNDGLSCYCRSCIAERQRLRYWADPAKMLEQQRVNRKSEKYKVRNRATQSKRRAKGGGIWTRADIGRLMLTQRHKCAHTFCRASLKGKYHIDHIVPVALGGSNQLSNIQLLCVKCNLSKSATHPVDFAQMNGLLL